MKVGSLIFSTEQGLGILARSFFNAGVLTEVLIVRHGRRPEHPEWYPSGTEQLGNLRSSEDILRAKAFCERQDVMLFFESPFIWELIPHCRKHGVKTVLQVQYECMPTELPYQPDLILCPSLLDQQYFPHGIFIPVPVEVPWRLRKNAEVFVHNAGHGGLRNRNGTYELIKAMEFVKSPIRLILRLQPGSSLASNGAVYLTCMADDRVDWREGNFPYDSLYQEGDVFVFPTKFDALSLPIQEAWASGMMVMTGDRFPMNTWLPREPMIPIAGYSRQRVSQRCVTFDEARYEPKDIAATIDAWYGQDTSEFSYRGKEWAEKHSWQNLKPRYLEALSR